MAEDDKDYNVYKVFSNEYTSSCFDKKVLIYQHNLILCEIHKDDEKCKTGNKARNLKWYY